MTGDIMKDIRMYYNVVDCEHEGDIYQAEYELEDIGPCEFVARYVRTDDEGEICGCEICISVREEDVEKFRQFGCYQ